MTHVAGHSSTSPYSDSEYDFLFPSGGTTPLATVGGTGITLQDFLFKNLQPGVEATANTLTIAATGDKITLVLDDNGNVIDTVLTRASDAVGPITALTPITLPGGWLLVPMTGGAKPVIIPPSKDRTGQFLEIPGDPSQILAFDANGGIKVIQRNQAPIAAVEIGFEFQSDGTMRTFFADGTHRDTAPVSQFELGQIEERGDAQYVETSPGNFSRVPKDMPPGEVVNIGGRDFTRQPDGTIQPLPPERTPSMEDLIVRALLDDDIESAIALDNFQNRPSSMEFFQASLAFARSPGDVAAISAIARGQTLVEPGPPGSVQRIAEQPEFLRDSFQQLASLFRGGGGAPNDIVSALTQASARMTEDNKARTEAEIAQEKAEQALRDKDQAEQAAKFKELQDQLNELQNTPQLDTTFAGTPLGTRVPGSTVLDSDAALSKLIDEAAAREPRFEEQISAPSQPTPSPVSTPFISEENQQIIDQPTPVSAPFVSEENQEIIDTPTTVNSSLTGLSLPEDDLFASGGVFDDRTAILGEDGPELVVLPVGTTVLSNKDSRKVDSVEELKKRLRGTRKRGKKTRESRLKEMLGVQSLEHGGVFEPLLLDPNEPFITPQEDLIPAGPLVPPPVDSSGGVFGVSQVLRGGSLEPTRRRLSTAAGLPVLSAQSRQRLLPSELGVLDELRAQAGITRADFEQEQRSALPGARVSRASRLAARIAR